MMGCLPGLPERPICGGQAARGEELALRVVSAPRADSFCERQHGRLFEFSLSATVIAGYPRCQAYHPPHSLHPDDGRSINCGNPSAYPDRPAGGDAPAAWPSAVACRT